MVIMDKYNRIFSFSFTSTDDRDQVWNAIIWHVNNALLVLREWNHTLATQEHVFASATF